MARTLQDANTTAWTLFVGKQANVVAEYSVSRLSSTGTVQWYSSSTTLDFVFLCHDCIIYSTGTQRMFQLVKILQPTGLITLVLALRYDCLYMITDQLSNNMNFNHFQ